MSDAHTFPQAFSPICVEWYIADGGESQQKIEKPKTCSAHFPWGG